MACWCVMKSSQLQVIGNYNWWLTEISYWFKACFWEILGIFLSSHKQKIISKFSNIQFNLTSAGLNLTSRKLT